MNIYQRLNEVRKAVDYVQKAKRVGEGGYLAVTHDAVTALTREHFIKHGVVIVPSIVSSAVQPTGTTTAKGVPFIRYEAKYRFTVANVEKPDDCFSLDMESHAIDQGDKAPGKALSYAKKYVVLKLLEIESGEEADSDEARPFQKTAKVADPNVNALPPPPPLTREQKRRVEEIASAALDHMNGGDYESAYGLIDGAGLEEPEEKLFLWSFFDSKQRTALKKIDKERRPFNKATGTYDEHPASQA